MTPIRVSIIGAIIALGILLVVLELVRRRRLGERYALLWIFTALVLLVLSAWRGSLDAIAELLGVAYPPIILVAISAVFVILVLLHVSVVLTRLVDQNRVLAQDAALLRERVRELEDQRGAD